MTSSAAPLARGLMTAGAAIVAVLITWRVLVTGFDQLLQSSVTAKPELARAPLEAVDSERPWRERLARNPADVGALLVLALELERTRKLDEARAAMRQAMHLAPADRFVLTNAANLFLRAGDGAQALIVLRRLVDLYPAKGNDVWPVFSAALDTGGSTEFFVGIARDNPAWWPAFFQFACAKARDTSGMQRLFAVRTEGKLVTADERRCLVARLQGEGRWDTAYQLWLNSLPRDQQQRIGYVFNGGFELPLSNLGFDWLTPEQDGVKVEADTTEGVTGRRALRATFVQKRYAGPPVYQYTMLYPGNYRLEGRARSDALDSWLGLQWGLYCQDAPGREPRQLARSDSYLGSSEWTDFHQDFVVPRNCPVQILRLELANPRRDAPTPGTAPIRLRGSIWFDDLRIATP